MKLHFFQSVATSIHISTYRNTEQNLRVCKLLFLDFFESVATSIHISTHRNTKQNLPVCKLLFFKRRTLRACLPYFECADRATKIKLYYVMRFFIELIFSLQIFPSSPPDVVCPVCPVCPVCSILGVKG